MGQALFLHKRQLRVNARLCISLGAAVTQHQALQLHTLQTSVFVQDGSASNPGENMEGQLCRASLCRIDVLCPVIDSLLCVACSYLHCW
jgi:hypothetical protein